MAGIELMRLEKISRRLGVLFFVVGQHGAREQKLCGLETFLGTADSGDSNRNGQ
jgi:hypothetical protein